MLSSRQSGFTIIEGVLSVALVGAIGLAAYFAVHAPQQSKVAASPTPSPAAAVQAYTTQYERLAFTYPSGYSLKDDSTATSATNIITPGNDVITLTGSGNFAIDIYTGATGRGGGCSDCKVLKSTPVTVLGKPYYINYVSTDGSDQVNDLVVGADTADIMGANIPGKYVTITNPGDTKPTVLPIVVSASYTSGSTTVKKSAADYAAAAADLKAVVQSFHY